MKTTMTVTGMRMALLLALAMVGGCQTDSTGVQNTAGSYSAMLDATPDKVTSAAKKSVEQLKLMDVNSNSTKVDGRVTARTADNTEVTINIEKAGDNVSRMTVRVGAMGDASISRQIIDKTKDNLHWF